MRQRILRFLSITAGIIAVCAMPAFANHIDRATVTADCTGYTIHVDAAALFSYSTFTITYQIVLTPSSGPAITVNGSIPVTPDANFNFSGSETKTWASLGITLNGNYALSGSAALYGDNIFLNQVDIVFTPTMLTCPGTCAGVIGDFVWNDTNHNGIQDSGEPGIPGVTMQLWDSTQTTLLQTTMTNAGGLYQFSGLCAGTYVVVVPNSPPGFTPSPSHVGMNPAIDSNGSPAPVTLPTNNSSDLTIDFGFFQNACVPSPVFMLGSAGSFTVLGLDNGSVTISEGATKVTGDVGVGPNDGGALLKATIKGALKLDPTAHPDIHPDLIVTGGTTIVGLGSATAAAVAASNNLASMVPTQSFGDITTSTTFNSTQAVNVISLKSVNLVKGTITIKGGPSDVFVFQVAGQFNFSSSQMILSGGVTPNNIIWNFAGAGGDIDIFKDVTTAYGFFLGPQRNIIQDHATVTGGYIGLNVTIHSAAIVNYPCP